MEDSASSDASSDTTAEAASESSSRMSWAYDAKEDGLVGDLLNSMTSDLAPKSKTQTAPKRASSPPTQVSSKKAKKNTSTKSKPTKTSAPPSPAVSVRSVRSAPQFQRQNTQEILPKPKDEVGQEDATKPKSRGKGSCIPSDPVEILRRDNYYVTEGRFKGIIDQLGKGPFDTCLLKVSERSEFRQSLKKIQTAMSVITKEIGKIQTLALRRNQTPEEVMTTIKTFRLCLKHLHLLLSDATTNQKAIDIEKIQTSLKLLVAEKYDPGVAIKTCVYKAVVSELVRFGKFEAVKDEMCFRTGFNARYPITSDEHTWRQLNSSVIESSFFKILDSVDAKKPDVTKGVLDKATAFCQQVSDVVELSQRDAFRSCGVLFSLADDTDYMLQEKTLESFERCLVESGYVGFEKTVAQHVSWPSLAERIRLNIKEQKKLHSGFNLIKALLPYVSTMANVSDTMSMADLAVVADKVTSLVASLKDCDPGERHAPKFIEFLRQYQIGASKILASMKAAVVRAVDELTNEDNADTMERYLEEGFMALSNMLSRITNVDIGQIMEDAKPWRFKTADIEDIMERIAPLKATATSYQNVFRHLCETAIAYLREDWFAWFILN